jgi:hypothetical protein
MHRSTERRCCSRLLVLPRLSLLCLALAASCGRSGNNGVPGKYVGMLTGDTSGTSRSIIELREDGGVRWTMGTERASYAVRGDTVFVDLASGMPMVVPLVIREDSLIWRDKDRTYGVWLRAEQ